MPNPTQTPPPTGDPYEFIMNPAKPPKKPAVNLGGQSTLQRVAIFGGGLVILIILVVIVAGLISSSGKAGTEDLVAVAQEQTELARVATDGTQNATSQATQNLAGNVSLSMTSANAQLLAYLKTTGQKVGTKTLTIKHTATTDTTLANAKTDSTYDTAFTTIIQADLASYTAELQKAFKANPGPKGKALLSSQYDAAQLLMTQSKQN